MKYKIIGIVMAAVMVAAAFLALPMETVEQTGGRIHQHLSSRKDTGCDCDGSQLCSHLPLVIIDTGGQTIPGTPTEERDMFGQPIYTTAEDGSSTIRAQVSVVDNGDSNNHSGDEADISTLCELRLRGNSSRRFPKMPYSLKFINEDGSSNDLEVMGMGAHHDWALHGPILDKTMIRNYMWYNIAGEIMEYAPNTRFCGLVLNGEYQGLYLMVETITDGEDCRLNLTRNVRGTEMSGYLLRVDRPVEADLETDRDVYTYLERSSQIMRDVAIRFPGKSDLTPELAEEIELDYAVFEKCLYSYDHDTEDYGYWNWIDVDNFVDYFLINEFTGNLDAGSYSTYIYKEVGGKYKLCVWDFNNACDNYQEDETEPAEFHMTEAIWYFMLLKDEEFVERILERYEQLRQTYLSDEYLMEYIDDTLEYLGPALERNNQRWAAEIEGWEGLLPAERNLHSHGEAVAQLKEWLLARGAWLDAHIDILRQYSHPSRNKVYNH